MFEKLQIKLFCLEKMPTNGLTYFSMVSKYNKDGYKSKKQKYIQHINMLATKFAAQEN